MIDGRSSFSRVINKSISYRYRIASFFMPILLLGICFISWQIHPFGNSSLLTADLFHQYAPLLTELRNKILSLDSLFYTWNMGLGTNFWAVIAYYGASPLNLILLLFPQNILADGITLLILLRVGLSGFFFFWLLREKDSQENGFSLGLSLVYALSGFMLAYFWNIMWMDAVVLLPLVVLGLWRLLTGKKPIFYIVSLFLLIFSNFYMGFMVCLFLVFLGPVLYLEVTHKCLKKHTSSENFFRVLGSTLVAVGMAAVMLVPGFLTLKATGVTAGNLFEKQSLAFNFFDFVSRFLWKGQPTVESGLPNMYSGVMILLLIPLYAFCKAIPFSQRLASLALAFILYISMCSEAVNFLWNGRMEVTQLPFRQSFLLVFWLLYLGSQVLLHIKTLSRSMVIYSGGAVLMYIVILVKDGLKDNLWLIYGSAALALAYMMIFIKFVTSPKHRPLLKGIFLYLVVFELVFAAEFAVSYLEKTEQFTYLASYGQQKEEIGADLTKMNQDRFARTAFLPPITGNDGALYNQKTLAVFSATTPKNYTQFMAGLGFANNGLNSVQAEGLTPVNAMLLGISSRVDISGVVDEVVDGVYDNYLIDYNSKVLPLGFYVPTVGDSNTLDPALSPFEQTNNLLTAMGTGSVYRKGQVVFTSGTNLEKTSSPEQFSIINSDQPASVYFSPEVFVPESPVLLYLGSKQTVSVRITRTDKETGNSTTVTLMPAVGSIIDCGDSPSADSQEQLVVQLIFDHAEQETFSLYCYTINQEDLQSSTAALSSVPLTLEQFSSNMLSGRVSSEQDGFLLLTVPYDKGWQARVDGIVVSTVPAYDALSAIPVTAGQHQITLSYSPPGFFLGLLLTIFGAIVFAIICLWGKWSSIGKRIKAVGTSGGVHPKTAPPKIHAQSNGTTDTAKEKV